MKFCYALKHKENIAVVMFWDIHSARNLSCGTLPNVGMVVFSFLFFFSLLLLSIFHFQYKLRVDCIQYHLWRALRNASAVGETSSLVLENTQVRV